MPYSRYCTYQEEVVAIATVRMTPEHRNETDPQNIELGIPPGLISETLIEILESVPFRTSKQCQELFRYMVEHSTGHDEESLKERVIGSEVFGRRLDYNTAEDPVVRVRAGEVRKRLALFYRATRHDAKVEIDIPLGSYRAVFRPLPALQLESAQKDSSRTASGPSSPSDPQEKAEGDPNSPSAAAAVLQEANVSDEASTPVRAGRTNLLLKTRVLFPTVLIAAAVALLIGSFWYHHQTTSPFDSFWNPIVASSKAPIIYVAGNVVYILYDRKPSAPDSGGKSPDGFYLDQTNFVTKGDASALSSIAWMLSRFKKPYDLRFSNDITVSDMSESPIIRIGAFNNAWTLKMDDQLPLVFKPPLTIQEAASPHRTWVSALDSHGVLTEDYSLVSRQLHSKTGGVAFTIAGITMAGTRASAEFVSDPVRMSRALKQLPSGWQQKSVELLLHSNISNDLPTSTEVVAYRVW